MSTNFKIDPELAEAISDVLTELASELDLHYEDGDFFALTPSITRMKRLADLLKQEGYVPPPAYDHVLQRFHKHHQ